jgi:hypothetical protein
LRSWRGRVTQLVLLCQLQVEPLELRVPPTRARASPVSTRLTISVALGAHRRCGAATSAAGPGTPPRAMSRRAPDTIEDPCPVMREHQAFGVYVATSCNPLSSSRTTMLPASTAARLRSRSSHAWSCSGTGKAPAIDALSDANDYPLRRFRH